MTLRRLSVAMLLVCGLCVWGFAGSNEVSPATADADPVHAESGAGEGGTHEDAVARFRGNQSRHWRHVAIGTQSSRP
jgi:hypothetical protein